MGRAKHSSTMPDNPSSSTRRRINHDTTVTTYDGVVPTIHSTVRIMTPGNGYLKFGIVMVKNLWNGNIRSGIPDVGVKLYNGDYIVRPQNEVRVYGDTQNHFYDFMTADGKFLSVGDKVTVLEDGGYTGIVEELLPLKVWVKTDSGEYVFVDHQHVFIVEEFPTFTWIVNDQHNS